MTLRLLIALFLLALAPQAAATAAGPLPASQLCRAAIAQAERESGIPPGLLQAIGRVESGRRDPATGEVAPWPWVINADGQGRFFPDKAEAIAFVRQIQPRARLIDIGCMQINLHHHPNAFPSLEEAFDPLANARYAARFLKELQASRGDWLRAAGNYHSNTPDRADAYRAAVAAAWPGEQARMPAGPYQPPMQAGGGGMGARGIVGVTMMPGRGGASERGRGLDAYRAMPIMMLSRR